MGLFTRKKSPQRPPPIAKTCCLCRESLQGAVVYDAWKNGAHGRHNIFFCNSCDRILSPYGSKGAFQYSDGRKICGYCKKSAILDGIAANQSRRRVLGLLEGLGFKGIPKNIKIVLAHPQTLSNHSRKANTSGLTLSHFHFSDYKRVGITHQIGILSGLPKIEFEAVMAHEFLHVWQHDHDVKFSPLYAEGLCELAGYAVYLRDGSELASHLLQKMQQNKDPVYGNGFRLMHKKLEMLGWQGLIQEVLKNKRGFEATILKKIFGRS